MRSPTFRRLREILGSRTLALSAGLVLLSLCLLLIADLSGLRDDGSDERRQAREALAETLSLRLSLLARSAEPATVEAAVERIVSDTPSIEAATLHRAADGSNRRFGAGYASTDDVTGDGPQALVPIFDGASAWGELAIAFRGTDAPYEDALYFGVLAFALLLAYLAYLGKALVQLDPSRAIPERVDSAFNMLVEGVIVLDERLRVLMANEAAAAAIGRESTDLIGDTIEHWPWVRDVHWQSPWTTVLETGLAIVDHPVVLARSGTGGSDLADADSANYTLNCSLIRDDAGRAKGVMITLTDLSAIERKNRELSSTLVKLRRSQESITKKNRELEALASQDPLTGLNNRRAVVARLGEHLHAAIDRASALACIMVDIDHFKRINDTFGHAVGDEVICAVANALVDQSRDNDVVGRIGGEEFVVVLPDTDLPAAMLIAERIRARIERLASDVTVPVETLSASLGVATHEAGVETLEQLLDRADQGLYAAKNGGRNRVVAFDEAEMGGTDDPSIPDAGEPSGASPAPEIERLLAQKSRDLDTLRTFDPETGLPRRDVFVERVGRAIEQARHAGTSFALLSIAPRDHERIAASLGRAASAQLLAEFVRRLDEDFRRSDTIAEIAGEHGVAHIDATEFGVLLENVSDPADALTIMTRVRRLLAAPIVVDGTRVHTGGNIGVTLHPRDGDTPERLIERAGTACCEAANEPDTTSLRFADEQAAAPTRESLEMESDLYEAVEKGEFSVHYQPKFRLSSQSIEGVEALVRWQHPERGWVAPSDFIPLAERNGLIEDISAFVTRTALAQLAAWHHAGFDHVGLAMNVSATQLRHPELVPNLLGALESAGVSSEHVEVELTETAVIESPQRARIALGQLRSAGVSVSMDDFGIGYTSLALLAELPLDSVKIDRSFVEGMIDNERSRAIVRSIVDMGRALGLSVIGEGVETNEQLTMLAAFGCNDVQGYLISRPLDAEGMSEFLERQARDSRQRRRA